MKTIRTSVTDWRGTEWIIEIVRNHSITIKNKDHCPVPRTFRMGDTVEYGSYNLIYTGEITGIGPKTVTVKDKHKPKARRLKLVVFCSRNHDLDLDAIARSNHDTLMHI